MCISCSWLKSQAVAATISGRCRTISSTTLPACSLMVADTTSHSTPAMSPVWACRAGSASEEWAYELFRSIQSNFMSSSVIVAQTYIKNADYCVSLHAKRAFRL